MLYTKYISKAQGHRKFESKRMEKINLNKEKVGIGILMSTSIFKDQQRVLILIKRS